MDGKGRKGPDKEGLVLDFRRIVLVSANAFLGLDGAVEGERKAEGAISERGGRFVFLSLLPETSW